MEHKDRNYLLGIDRGTLKRYQLFNQVYQPVTEEVFAKLAIKPDMRVLEVGCGIGQTACYMAEHVVPQGHVVAFDMSADLVEIAKQQAIAMGINNITFHCSKAETFDYPARYFDVAHTRYVLSYLPTAKVIVQHIFNSLKKGGIFFGEELYLKYILHQPPQWLTDIVDWFGKLIKSGDGNPNYGLEQFPSDILSAGFDILEATIRFPNDKQKFIDLVKLALANEMREPLIKLSIATTDQVDACLERMNKTPSESYISSSAVAQIVATR
ncbi:MAG: class I SAM-dependent methyltransferase [Pseudomonadota bacterium]